MNFLRSYYLSDGVKKFGPYTRPQIIEMLKNNQISMMSFIWDSENKVWDPIYKHSDFTVESMNPAEQKVILGLEPDYDISKSADWAGNLSKVNETKVSPTQKKQTETEPAQENRKTNEPKEIKTDFSDPDPDGSKINTVASKNSENTTESLWEMKMGAVHLGPYTFLKMLNMIRDGDLREADFVRRVGVRDWQEARHVPDFKPEYLRTVNSPQVEDLLSHDYFRRESSRRDFHYPLIVFDGHNHYHVVGADVSLGGISFVSRPPILQIGQIVVIKLEHAVTKAIPGYHAKAKVLKADSVTLREEGGECFRYGCEFSEVMPAVNEFLKGFISSVG